MKPTDIVKCEGYTMYYYGATAADQHVLPIGDEFVVVYSPSPFDKKLGWRAVRYQIARYGGRYQEQSRLDLSDADVEQVLWEAMGS